MAAGAFTVYGHAKLLLGQGGMVITSGATNLYAVLATTSYSPAPNTDATYSNVSGSEASGTGYTAGGQQLTGVTWSVASGTATFSTSSPSWSASTISARYLVIVARAGGSAAGTDPLLGYADLTGSGNASSNAGIFSATTPSSGWFTLT